MQNIDIDLKPSRAANLLILILSLGSLLIVITLSVSWALKAVFVFLLFYTVRDLWLRINSPVVQGLRLINREECQLRLKDKTLLAVLCGDSTVTNRMSVLRFKSLGRKKIYSCVIIKDSVPSRDYHALLVWLRTL